MEQSTVDVCIKALRNALEAHLLPLTYERWVNEALSCLEVDGKPSCFDDYYIIRLVLWVCIGVFGDEQYKRAYLEISKIVMDKTRNT